VLPRRWRTLQSATACVFVITFAIVQERSQAQVQKGTVDTTGRTGAQLYDDTCAACHGVDGAGKDASVLGFDVPTPDFTDCSFATREPDADWMTVAHEGGPARGFSTHMPAFGGALAEADLYKILDHVRTFCADPAWPRGELNLPRALHTEKAYPEDEAVMTVGLGRSPGSFATEFVYEKRFGARNQIEFKLPFEAARESGNWAGGAGDLVFGFKRAFAHSLEKGMIAAGAAEIIFPTGDESAGLSSGTPIFESFFSYGQILPRDSFLQFQAGVELPFDTDKAGREAFWRIAGGKTITQQGPFGRAWSPMLELLAARDLEAGATTHWDLVPQVQVTLNTRQHIMLNAGWRTPLNDRRGRPSRFLVYILWDWFDGGLRDGW
jgi:mono/diheme cytochrome c family protein